MSLVMHVPAAGTRPEPKDLSVDKLLGHRKRNIAAPGQDGGGIAACLSPMASPKAALRSIKSESSMRQASGILPDSGASPPPVTLQPSRSPESSPKPSPGRRTLESPTDAKGEERRPLLSPPPRNHVLHSRDNVPLGTQSTPKFERHQSARARGFRPENELDVDTFHSIRTFHGSEKYRSSTTLRMNSPDNRANESAVFVGTHGKAMGSKRCNVNKTGDNDPTSSASANQEYLLGSAGPRGSAFRPLARISSKRHAHDPPSPVLNQEPLGSPRPEQVRSPAGAHDSVQDILQAGVASPRPQTRQAGAAGIISPRHERGIVPTGCDDNSFRFSSRQGSVRTYEHPPSNTLEKGLNPESTLIQKEAMLGERRRKAHGSPWASPRSSPFMSPTATPPETPPRRGGASPPPRGSESSICWNSIAAQPEEDGERMSEAVRDPASASPSVQARRMAVTDHRPKLRNGEGIPVPQAEDWKYRDREKNAIKGKVIEKRRWRS